MLFNLSFPNNTILSCVFFFFLIIDLYCLIPAVIAKIFISTAELVIPTETQTNETNAEIEMEAVFLKLEQASFQHNLNTYMSSYIFY